MKATRETTSTLFEPREPGGALAKIVLTEEGGTPKVISAALAIRTAGLPYQPVLDPEGRTGAPRATVRFHQDAGQGGESPRPGIETREAIPATMTFPDTPGAAPVRFHAGISMAGENEWSALIRHVPGFKMPHDDLADLLFDAYLEGNARSTQEMHWTGRKLERERLRRRMAAIATAVLDGPAEGFAEMLANYLAEFSPGIIGWPEEKVDTETETGHPTGLMSASFNPQPEDNPVCRPA